MEERISIIVPVYNAEKTLTRCVSSLTGQTYQNIEIILVNDGSKDDSLALCRRFAAADPRIRIIDKPNGGVSSARNAGLDAAGGDFVMFCDSDDWAEPEWCGCMQSHYLPEHLTVCEIRREDVPCQEHPVPEETVERKFYLHHQMLMCAPYNKIFRREVIEKHRLRFSKELSLGEDFVFCLNYLCAISGNVRYVYRGLYNYDTSNENSLSNRAPALNQCQLFYRAVTDAMERLEATDEKSILTRDTFVAPHFERFIQVTARNRELSFGQKMAAAAQVQQMQAFRDTCRRGIRWGNPLYVWLCRNAHVRLAMLYLILKQRLKGN